MQVSSLEQPYSLLPVTFWCALHDMSTTEIPLQFNSTHVYALSSLYKHWAWLLNQGHYISCLLSASTIPWKFTTEQKIIAAKPGTLYFMSFISQYHSMEIHNRTENYCQPIDQSYSPILVMFLLTYNLLLLPLRLQILSTPLVTIPQLLLQTHTLPVQAG